jgi:hypothetical protein
MHDRAHTVKQPIEQLTPFDMSLNKSQSESGPNTTTTTKASTRKIDSKKGSTTGTACQAKDDSLTCSNCGQVGHISRNGLNRDRIKTLLEQDLACKDAPKGNPGPPHKPQNWASALAGRNLSRQLAEEKEAKQETDSEAESGLKSLLDSDSERGTGKGGQ